MHSRFLFLIPFAALAQPPGGPGPGGQGDGIWLRNAYYGERETFDACLAHQPGNGDYHNHVQPVCLRAQLGDNLELVYAGRTGSTYREKAGGWTHSPILGWAFDGYPVYGPYGYSDPKGATSPVRRIRTSFRLRAITERTSLPDWLAASHAPVSQKLDPSQYGPPVNVKFPLGRYQEDFDYVEGSGDLDQYNGRFTITPEYPSGTYAYFVTIDADGNPAFPYILARQYYGAVTAGPPGPGGGVGSVQQVPADATDYFANGQLASPLSTDALIASFPTRNSAETARAVIGWDPAAGPQATWPVGQPARAMPASGGVTAPVNADVQRIRMNAGSVYLNSNGLPSHPFGPWFASGNGGVFNNFPSRQNYQMRIPRMPAQPSGVRTTTPMGAAGIWVNGVALFNALDGGSYKTSAGADAGGGPVNATAIHRAASSLEGGPVTAGSIVTAFANFGAVLATSTETAATPNWPLTLGGTAVTVIDANGGTFQAPIAYASPTQVNYRVPQGVADGVANVRISAGGADTTGGINIVPVYPGVFKVNEAGLAAAQVARLRGGQVVYESALTPISLANPAENATLVLFASGLNGAKDVAVEIGGEKAGLLYAGPQGTWAGLEQINATIPVSLAGRGRVDVVVTADGKRANPVYVVVQ